MIIKILFLVGVILSVIFGLSVIFVGLREDSVSVPLVGLLYLLVGPLVVRVYCEIFILAFQIHESLVQIEKNTRPMAEHAETKIQ